MIMSNVVLAESAAPSPLWSLFHLIVQLSGPKLYCFFSFTLTTVITPFSA